MKHTNEYYQELMKENATSLEKKNTNSKGQEIEFYECPKSGDTAPVIAVCHELKAASDTFFFDTDDMFEGSDYIPVFIKENWGFVMFSEYQLR